MLFHRRVLLVLSPVTVATLLCVAAPAIAGDLSGAAEESTPMRQSASPSGDETQSIEEEASLVEAEAGPSPSGCGTGANYPHVSTSASTRGLVKGYGYAECRVRVAGLGIATHVKEKKWYGWVRSGKVVPGDGQNLLTIGRSGVATVCTNALWKTVAEGWSQEATGRYISVKAVDANVTKC